ncbi:gem-associated protein 8-like [Neocloeon triangulifer]|uniref:gem-associated protein 8-like n=1 Tax=Neocloeon triangulifer TaxID=2078957 RepID=UPI00286ED72E|nr:gem-associated protein 8-like [Neocloeon triangulifer]
MSTKACQKLAVLVQTGKKSDKLAIRKNQGVGKRKRARRRDKRRLRNRTNQHQQGRRNFPPRRVADHHNRLPAMNQKQPGHAFWENYKNAMEWQNKHFINYWKARCAALEMENQHLYRALEQVTCSSGENNNFQQNESNEGNKSDYGPEDLNDEEVNEPQEEVQEQKEQVEEDLYEGECVEEEIEEDFTFEVDGQMLEFLEISAKHKIELKKKRDAERELEDAEGNKEEEEKKLPKQIMEERKLEMERLYGAEAAPMILGMETAMQLSFDRFNDKYHPKHWPNIPLNL